MLINILKYVCMLTEADSVAAMDPHGNSAQERPRTVDEVVALNVAALRRAAGLTQQQLGELIGWTKIQVSEAERSADGKKIRRFDATTLAALAEALGIPLIALFLPPTDGTRVAIRGRADDGTRLMRLLMPDNEEGTAVADAYRERFKDSAIRLFADDPDWARVVARWAGGSPKTRAERAWRIRESRDALAKALAVLDELSDAIEIDSEERP